MEIVSTSNVISFETSRRENEFYDTKYLSKSTKANLNNSANLKAGSLISKKKAKKTKIKMQEKTKESLAFNTNTSNSNAYRNINNYFSYSNRKNLKNFKEQDEGICINSNNLVIFKENLTQLDKKVYFAEEQKMIVNSFHVNQNLRNQKSKKSKKIKKKKIVKSVNFSHEIVDETNQSDPKNKIEIDYNTIKNNESIRWENELMNEKDEAERIELYKINRRKRYIDQKNKILKIKLQNDLACDFSLSSSSTCSMENIDSKSFQNNLENIVEVDKMDNKNTDQKDKEANVLIQNRNKSSSVCLIVKREKERDSAISSISSNSQMF